jgi:regulator of sirC expression with transglutaminase-like and TPR domain
MPRPEDPVSTVNVADELAEKARGLLRRNRGQAEQLARKALAKQPGHRGARRVLASVLSAKAKSLLYSGDNTGALAAATRATQLNPGHANAWFYQGVARYELERKAGARRSLRRFVKLCPRCGYNTTYARQLLKTLAR